jgi:hypothetical protein
MFREVIKFFSAEGKDVISLKQKLGKELLDLFGDRGNFMATPENQILGENGKVWFLPEEKKFILLYFFQEEAVQKKADAAVYSPPDQWQVFSNRLGLSLKGNGGVFKISDLILPQVWDVGQQVSILEFFLEVLRSSRRPLNSF